MKVRHSDQAFYDIERILITAAGITYSIHEIDDGPILGLSIVADGDAAVQRVFGPDQVNTEIVMGVRARPQAKRKLVPAEYDEAYEDTVVLEPGDPS